MVAQPAFRPPQSAPPRPAIQKPDFDYTRIYAVLWGMSGCGKTTLAATAPGKKLIVQFDPQGATSIANRDDFYLLDVSGSTYNATMAEFNNIDPFGLKAFLNENPDVETVIIDSITTLAFLALQFAVQKPGGSRDSDVPRQDGYGTRNNVMRRVVQSIMQICSQTGRHLIVITHEGSPDEDTKEVTMSLSKALANDVSLRFNEVWYMKDTGKERLIHTRAFATWRPMKSRMFKDGIEGRFTWQFDADNLEGEGIAEWFTQWQQNGGKKIPLPIKK